MPGPQLQATLSFTVDDLEELIAQQVKDSGYIMQELDWDEGRAIASVRPMTAQERADHDLPTKPVENRISEAVKDAIGTAFAEARQMLEERVEIKDELRMLNAKLEGVSAAVVQLDMRAADPVVQEPASPTPSSPTKRESENGVSMKSAIEEEVGDGLTKQEREDRQAYRARLKRIRSELEEGNRHPDLPDANKRLRSDHEFDVLPEELRNT